MPGTCSVVTFTSRIPKAMLAPAKKSRRLHLAMLGLLIYMSPCCRVSRLSKRSLFSGIILSSPSLAVTCSLPAPAELAFRHQSVLYFDCIHGISTYTYVSQSFPRKCVLTCMEKGTCASGKMSGDLNVYFFSQLSLVRELQPLASTFPAYGEPIVNGINGV